MSRIINLCQIRTGHVQENGNCQDCSVAALSGDKRRNLNSHHTVSYILRIHVIAIHNNIGCLSLGKSKIGFLHPKMDFAFLY